MFFDVLCRLPYSKCLVEIQHTTRDLSICQSGVVLCWFTNVYDRRDCTSERATFESHSGGCLTHQKHRNSIYIYIFIERERESYVCSVYQPILAVAWKFTMEKMSRERYIPLHVSSILMDPLTLTISSLSSMPRTYCTATWPTLTSMSVSEVWQDAVFLFFCFGGGFLQIMGSRNQPRYQAIKQLATSQLTNQPNELNKLSNVRIFEKSTMKERMKE